MQFCLECQTLILKTQPNECRLCKSKLQKRETKTIFEKIYNNQFELKEEIENFKGTKIKNNCDNCSSDYMYYKALQTRGADEGQTIFFECDCGYKKKIDS